MSAIGEGGVAATTYSVGTIEYNRVAQESSRDENAHVIVTISTSHPDFRYKFRPSLPTMKQFFLKKDTYLCSGDTCNHQSRQESKQ